MHTAAMSSSYNSGLPPLPRTGKGLSMIALNTPAHSRMGGGIESPGADAWQGSADLPLAPSAGYSTPSTVPAGGASQSSVPGAGGSSARNVEHANSKDWGTALRSPRDMTDMPSSWSSLQELIETFTPAAPPSTDSSSAGKPQAPQTTVGLIVKPVDDDVSPAGTVTGFMEGSPAQLCGRLQLGDKIIAVDGSASRPAPTRRPAPAPRAPQRLRRSRPHCAGGRRKPFERDGLRRMRGGDTLGPSGVGSQVRLTVARAGSGNFDVALCRDALVAVQARRDVLRLLAKVLAAAGEAGAETGGAQRTASGGSNVSGALLTSGGSVRGADSLGGALRARLDDLERAHASTLRALRSELDGADALQEEAKAAAECALVEGKQEIMRLRSQAAELRLAAAAPATAPVAPAAAEAEAEARRECARLAGEVARLQQELQARTEEAMEGRAKLAQKGREHARAADEMAERHAAELEALRARLPTGEAALVAELEAVSARAEQERQRFAAEAQRAAGAEERAARERAEEHAMRAELGEALREAEKALGRERDAHALARAEDRRALCLRTIRKWLNASMAQTLVAWRAHTDARSACVEAAACWGARAASRRGRASSARVLEALRVHCFRARRVRHAGLAAASRTLLAVVSRCLVEWRAVAAEGTEAMGNKAAEARAGAKAARDAADWREAQECLRTAEERIRAQEREISDARAALAEARREGQQAADEAQAAGQGGAAAQEREARAALEAAQREARRARDEARAEMEAEVHRARAEAEAARQRAEAEAGAARRAEGQHRAMAARLAEQEEALGDARQREWEQGREGRAAEERARALERQLARAQEASRVADGHRARAAALAKEVDQLSAQLHVAATEAEALRALAPPAGARSGTGSRAARTSLGSSARSVCLSRALAKRWRLAGAAWRGWAAMVRHEGSKRKGITRLMARRFVSAARDAFYSWAGAGLRRQQLRNLAATIVHRAWRSGAKRALAEWARVRAEFHARRVQAGRARRWHTRRLLAAGAAAFRRAAAAPPPRQPAAAAAAPAAAGAAAAPAAPLSARSTGSGAAGLDEAEAMVEGLATQVQALEGDFHRLQLSRSLSRSPPPAARPAATQPAAPSAAPERTGKARQPNTPHKVQAASRAFEPLSLNVMPAPGHAALGKCGLRGLKGADAAAAALLSPNTRWAQAM